MPAAKKATTKAPAKTTKAAKVPAAKKATTKATKTTTKKTGRK